MVAPQPRPCPRAPARAARPCARRPCPRSAAPSDARHPLSSSYQARTLLTYVPEVGAAGTLPKRVTLVPGDGIGPEIAACVEVGDGVVGCEVESGFPIRVCLSAVAVAAAAARKA